MNATMQTSHDARPGRGAAELLREKVLLAINRAGLAGCTTHEVAGILGLPVPSVQPRVSELKAAGLIVYAKIRRLNAVSGKMAAVFIIPPPPGPPVQLGLFEGERVAR